MDLQRFFFLMFMGALWVCGAATILLVLASCSSVPAPPPPTATPVPIPTPLPTPFPTFSPPPVFSPPVVSRPQPIAHSAIIGDYAIQEAMLRLMPEMLKVAYTLHDLGEEDADFRSICLYVQGSVKPLALRISDTADNILFHNSRSTISPSLYDEMSKLKTDVEVQLKNINELLSKCRQDGIL